MKTEIFHNISVRRYTLGAKSKYVGATAFPSPLQCRTDRGSVLFQSCISIGRADVLEMVCCTRVQTWTSLNANSVGEKCTMKFKKSPEDIC